MLLPRFLHEEVDQRFADALTLVSFRYAKRSNLDQILSEPGQGTAADQLLLYFSYHKGLDLLKQRFP
ncbi:hypothetical protein D3C73_1609690 [compost metagenome]